MGVISPLNLVPHMVSLTMSKIDKLLTKMRNNPRDWKIEDIKAIADRFGIEYRQPGTSHVTFRAGTKEKVTIPARKPIKPIYIKLFIALIDGLGGTNNE
jgi:hypothetical protein